MAALRYVYALFAYLLFLGSFVYAVGFVDAVVVPHTIDGPVKLVGPWAWIVDAAILGCFAIQHSVMARPAFKSWWTRYVPESIERATYVLASSALLVVILVAWQPLPAIVWSTSDPVIVGLARAGQAAGWIVLVAATFMISHFELFGLTQAWRALRGRALDERPFTVRWLYRFVRHPLMLGFLVAFWVTPTMTVGHLLFAILTTGYIVVGTLLEERDLVAAFGERYERYRERVPMLVPFARRGGRRDPAAEARR